MVLMIHAALRNCNNNCNTGDTETPAIPLGSDNDQLSGNNCNASEEELRQEVDDLTQDKLCILNLLLAQGCVKYIPSQNAILLFYT